VICHVCLCFYLMNKTRLHTQAPHGNWHLSTWRSSHHVRKVCPTWRGSILLVMVRNKLKPSLAEPNCLKPLISRARDFLWQKKIFQEDFCCSHNHCRRCWQPSASCVTNQVVSIGKWQLSPRRVTIIYMLCITCENCWLTKLLVLLTAASPLS